MVINLLNAFLSVVHPVQLQPIVGGQTIQSNGDFNFQVVLLVYGLIQCGGFILNNKFAGTAAHCIKDQREDLVSRCTKIKKRIYLIVINYFSTLLAMDR